MKYSQRAELSWNFLQSWADSNFRLHGIVATFWDSSDEVTAPHVMNHFPVVEGLKILYEKFGDSLFRDLVEQQAEFLLESFNPDTRLYENAWGDLPGKKTGTVHQAAASGALLDAYKVTGKQVYLDVALSNLKYCREYWPGALLNGVANQALKYAHAVSRLKDIDSKKFLFFKSDLEQFRDYLTPLVRLVPRGGALLDQSTYSAFQMTVYEAKCLHGLKALADADISRDWSISLINSMVIGIVHSFYVGSGMFLSHRDYAPSMWQTITRYSTAALRRLPWPDRGNGLEKMRRRILHKTCRESFQMEPIWLARIADLAYIFQEVEPFLEHDISSVTKETVELITTHQRLSGGVPNSLGSWMSGWQSWERSICSTRWNAYVFRLFSCLSKEKPKLLIKEIQADQWGDSFVTVDETSEKVECCFDNKSIIWKKPR